MTKLRAKIERMNGTARIIIGAETIEKLKQLISYYLEREEATKRVVIEIKEFDNNGLIIKETKDYYYEW